MPRAETVWSSYSEVNICQINKKDIFGWSKKLNSLNLNVAVYTYIYKFVDMNSSSMPSYYMTREKELL